MDSDFRVDTFLKALQESSFRAAAGSQEEGSPLPIPLPVPSSTPTQETDSDVDWPLLGRIRASWRALHAGSGDVAALRTLLVQARYEVEKKVQMLADSVACLADAAEDPLHRPLLRAMQEQGEAVSHLQSLLDAEPPQVEAALRRVQEATNRLDGVLRQGEERQEALIVRSCPRCFARCPDDAIACPRCGSMIPAMMP